MPHRLKITALKARFHYEHGWGYSFLVGGSLLIFFLIFFMVGGSLLIFFPRLWLSEAKKINKANEEYSLPMLVVETSLDGCNLGQLLFLMTTKDIRTVFKIVRMRVRYLPRAFILSHFGKKTCFF